MSQIRPMVGNIGMAVGLHPRVQVRDSLTLVDSALPRARVQVREYLTLVYYALPRRAQVQVREYLTLLYCALPRSHILTTSACRLYLQTLFAEKKIFKEVIAARSLALQVRLPTVIVASAAQRFPLQVLLPTAIVASAAQRFPLQVLVTPLHRLMTTILTPSEPLLQAIIQAT